MNCTLSRSAHVAFAVLAAGLIGIPCSAAAQDAPQTNSPKTIYSSVLAVSAGQTVTLQLRGLQLDTTTRVEAVEVEPAVEITLKKQEKASVPNPQQLGDTLVEIELKIPDTFTADAIPLVVHTPGGAAAPHRLLQIAKEQLVAEVEPNDGFRQSQPVEPGKTIQGIIQPKDPDVFQVTAKAGQRLTAEVIAARQGSPLDGILSVYDSSGILLATIDDTDQGVDPILTVAVPRDGDYLVVLQDAHDRGGVTHPYLFRARLE